MSRLFFKRKAIDDAETSFKDANDEQNKRTRLIDSSSSCPSNMSSDNQNQMDAQAFQDFIASMRAPSNVANQQQQREVLPQRQESMPAPSCCASALPSAVVSAPLQKATVKKETKSKPKKVSEKKPKQNQPKPKQRQTKQPKTIQKEIDAQSSKMKKNAKTQPSISKPKQVTVTGPTSLPEVIKSAPTLQQMEASTNRIHDERVEYELQRQLMMSQAVAQQDNMSVQEMYYMAMLQQQQQQLQQQQQQSYINNLLMQAAAMRQREQELADTELLHRLANIDPKSMTPELQQLLHQKMIMLSAGTHHDPYSYAGASSLYPGAQFQMGSTGAPHGYGYSR